MWSTRPNKLDAARFPLTGIFPDIFAVACIPQFVSELVAAYRRNDCSYPVFANLRNGLWYGKEWNGACYFKSTDGHSRR